jgi:imidazole glycerol-phosphate synthase subunit HisH
MIAIVDYGVGNVRAIANMIRKIGGECIITNKAEEINEASKIILPGVGAFDTAVQSLEQLNLKPALEDAALKKNKPLLGICLGMQLLTDGSEEGTCKGFGWIPGYSYKFKGANELKVPHMKWNNVLPVNSSALTKEIDKDARFYFVHSYYVKVSDPSHVLLQTKYGEDFAAAIQKENIYGVQFHPEKSHRFGMKIFSNFLSL